MAAMLGRLQQKLGEEKDRLREKLGEEKSKIKQKLGEKLDDATRKVKAKVDQKVSAVLLATPSKKKSRSKGAPMPVTQNYPTGPRIRLGDLTVSLLDMRGFESVQGDLSLEGHFEGTTKCIFKLPKNGETTGPLRSDHLSFWVTDLSATLILLVVETYPNSQARHVLGQVTLPLTLLSQWQLTTRAPAALHAAQNARNLNKLAWFWLLPLDPFREETYGPTDKCLVPKKNQLGRAIQLSAELMLLPPHWPLCGLLASPARPKEPGSDRTLPGLQASAREFGMQMSRFWRAYGKIKAFYLYWCAKLDGGLARIGLGMFSFHCCFIAPLYVLPIYLCLVLTVLSCSTPLAGPELEAHCKPKEIKQEEEDAAKDAEKETDKKTEGGLRSTARWMSNTLSGMTWAVVYSCEMQEKAINAFNWSDWRVTMTLLGVIWFCVLCLSATLFLLACFELHLGYFFFPLSVGWLCRPLFRSKPPQTDQPPAEPPPAGSGENAATVPDPSAAPQPTCGTLPFGLPAYPESLYRRLFWYPRLLILPYLVLRRLWSHIPTSLLLMKRRIAFHQVVKTDAAGMPDFGAGFRPTFLVKPEPDKDKNKSEQDKEKDKEKDSEKQLEKEKSMNLKADLALPSASYATASPLRSPINSSASSPLPALPEPSVGGISPKAGASLQVGPAASPRRGARSLITPRRNIFGTSNAGGAKEMAGEVEMLETEEPQAGTAKQETADTEDVSLPPQANPGTAQKGKPVVAMPVQLGQIPTLHIPFVDGAKGFVGKIRSKRQTSVTQGNSELRPQKSKAGEAKLVQSDGSTLEDSARRLDELIANPLQGAIPEAATDEALLTASGSGSTSRLPVKSSSDPMVVLQPPPAGASESGRASDSGGNSPDVPLPRFVANTTGPPAAETSEQFQEAGKASKRLRPGATIDSLRRRLLRNKKPSISEPKPASATLARSTSDESTPIIAEEEASQRSRQQSTEEPLEASQRSRQQSTEEPSLDAQLAAIEAAGVHAAEGSDASKKEEKLPEVPASEQNDDDDENDDNNDDDDDFSDADDRGSVNSLSDRDLLDADLVGTYLRNAEFE